MDIKQVREEIDYAGDHPLEFPLVHTAEWLLVQLEASQQQLAEAQEEAKKLQGMLLIMEIGCPLCGDNLVQYLTDELDVWCSACESNYAGMVVDEI